MVVLLPAASSFTRRARDLAEVVRKPEKIIRLVEHGGRNLVKALHIEYQQLRS